MVLSSSNLHLLTNPLLILLQKSKSLSHILQIQTQLVTTNLISNTLICNTIIKTLNQTSNPHEAFIFYHKMQKMGILGDNYTYPFVLKACGMMGWCCWEGKEVHGEVLKRGFEFDVFVGNGLIGMYCRCGEIDLAQALFDVFEGKDLVSWNIMVGGYVGCEKIGEAQKLFDEMPERDVVSWSIMIDGYGKKLGDIHRARVLFDSMPTKDLVTWNSMISSYAKVGEMVSAHQLFEEMPEKNIISWSIMIDGYAHHGDPKQALNLFSKMLSQGIKPDKVAVVGAVSACSQLGALDQGRWVHLYMKRRRITMDIVVQTALMDMYMKCGRVDEARSIFDNMEKRNVVSWNVMILGLGMNGLGEEALECFYQMVKERVEINDLIFLAVLTSCGHAGLVNEGLRVFDSMRRVYGIEPKVEHYGCLVDIFCRAGLLDEAQKVIETMPMKPNLGLWGSILLACKARRNVVMAESVVKRLVGDEVDDSGVYVYMSNIFADLGMWDGVEKMRMLMRERKVKKEIGRSVIEVKGSIEEFICGENCLNVNEEIVLVWRLLKMEMDLQ